MIESFSASELINCPVLVPGLSQTTDCGDRGKDQFGGAVTCFINPSTATNTLPTFTGTVTVYTLTGTVTGADGGLSTLTSSVSWTSSNIPATTTIVGQPQQTNTPIWVCVGELCNPKCKQSEPCDTSEDGGIGPLGFPWPLVSFQIADVVRMYADMIGSYHTTSSDCRGRREFWRWWWRPREWE